MKSLSVLLLLFITGAVNVVKAQIMTNPVWQWSVPVDGHIENNRDVRAYLWVPDNCKQIRGFVFAQNNMEEIEILENSFFRKAMTDIGFAEVWVSPFFDHLFRFNQGAGDIFNKMMGDLAEASGYSELEYAPVVPLGHSAAASWPYYLAAWAPNRTLAAISVSGQWPYFRSPVFAPDIWKADQNIDFIPSLETMGEYEDAENWATEGLKERQEHPYMPLSMLACPGEGHFATTDKKAIYLGLYIKKAADYRLPLKSNGQHKQELTKIDPTRSGWLVPKWRRDIAFKVNPAPVAEYKGDPGQAFWFFDKEMAMATIAYEVADEGKLPSFIEYLQNGKYIPLKETHQLVDLKFNPEADGVSFDLAAKFSDSVPGGSVMAENWTGLKRGSMLSHSENDIPLTINPIWGPVNKIGDKFVITFKRGMRAIGGSWETWFLASHPGDGSFKPISLQAKMTIPIKNRKGAEQVIHFQRIPNQKDTVKILQLHAYSTSALPVRYFVREGPAVIIGSSLIFTKVPPRAKWPVRVSVVAWQYGRSTKNRVQSAKPVIQSFNLFK